MEQFSGLACLHVCTEDYSNHEGNTNNNRIVAFSNAHRMPTKDKASYQTLSETKSKDRSDKECPQSDNEICNTTKKIGKMLIDFLGHDSETGYISQ